MNSLHALSRKYAEGGPVITRRDIEQLVDEALGSSAPVDTGLSALKRRFAEGGAVFGGVSGSGSSLGGRQEGDYWVYDDGSRYYNGGPTNADEETIRIMRTLGAQGTDSGKTPVVTHTPSAYGYDQNYDPMFAAQFWARQGVPEPEWTTPNVQPTYAPQSGAAFGGSLPASANPNPGGAQNQPPTRPDGSTAPGPAGNGMGIPGTSGPTRYPYTPTTVYQQPRQMSDAGSWFPINYNPARISDLVAHLRSQMYA